MFQHTGNGSHLSVGTDVGDQGFATPGGNGASHVHPSGLVELSVWIGGMDGLFAHCFRFSGEQAFLCGKTDAFQHHSVRCHPAACLQQQDVSYRHFLGGNGHRLPVPEHQGGGSREGLQGL